MNIFVLWQQRLFQVKHNVKCKRLCDAESQSHQNRTRHYKYKKQP